MATALALDKVSAPRALGSEPSVFFLWAVWSVDGLHYLDDLDQRPQRARWIAAGYRTDTIDLTHARWAAGTAMTALDLSAAALGARHNLPSERGRVQDIADLQRHRRQLCAGCRGWLNAVVRDPDFASLKSFRDPLTHRQLDRDVTL